MPSTRTCAAPPQLSGWEDERMSISLAGAVMPLIRTRADLDHRRVVESEFVDADAQHNRLAARRLARMCKVSVGTEDSAGVDDFIAGLCEIHRRRPRLQQEFDQAGLP